MTTLRAAAADYRQSGLSVFAVNGKKPLTRWKSFTDRLPTESELEKMPWGRATGIALALGPVSGGVIARDFDTTDSYIQWRASNPMLAQMLPTARTSRGYHVFFRWIEPIKTQTLGNGELRGEKAYIIIPPSQHPSGNQYQWLHGSINDTPVAHPE